MFDKFLSLLLSMYPYLMSYIHHVSVFCYLELKYYTNFVLPIHLMHMDPMSYIFRYHRTYGLLPR
jgi:hypothetical protein